MNRLKRLSLLLGLTAVFFIFVISLTSCGLADTAGSGLTNAVGTQENGPGSGKWNPPIPKTRQQCIRAYNVLGTVVEDTEEQVSAYDRLYVQCLDENGKLRDGQDSESCFPPLFQLAGSIHNYFVDFYTGQTVYGDSCGEKEDAPDPPDPPDPPDSGPPPAEDEDPDPDPSGCPPWCCLTCTHNLDTEFMYAPFRDRPALN